MVDISQSDNRLVLGLVGHGGSGKDTVARMLQAEGFEHVSASELLREEIQSRGIKPSRAVQNRIANEMRARNGAEYFVHLAMDRASNTTRPLVLSGIYAEAEATDIRHRLGGVIVAVITQESPELLYRRTQTRGEGTRDRLTLDEFMESRDRESSGSTPGEANIDACLNLSTHTIRNTSTLKALKDRVSALIRELLVEHRGRSLTE